MKVAIIGATGALGQELVGALGEAAGEALELAPPLLFASKRSVGEVFPWLEEEELVVEEYGPDELRGLDAALVAVPEAEAAKIVPRLRELGVLAIDASRAHRRSAPLFFADGVTSVAGASVVALPSAEALAVARILVPLAEHGPAWVRATVLRSASGAGKAGITELAESTGKLLNGQEPEVPLLGHRVAFNLIPQAGPFSEGTAEGEADFADELPRLVGDGLRAAATTAWAPWFYGHFLTLTIGFRKAPSLDVLRAALSGAPGVKVVDTPAEAIYPMPALATGDEAVLVGRLRADPLEPQAISCVLAVDNVRITAVQAIAALGSALRARRAH